MGILNRLGAFKKKCVVHTIRDGETEHEFKFYPPRFRNIANGRTRNILEPMVQAVTVLMSGGNDGKTQHIIYGENGQAVEASTMGQEPEVLKAVELRKRNAISDALGVLLNENTTAYIGELLADSLRDEFPAPSHQDYEGVVKQFMDEVTADVMIQFMMGYFKALVPFMDSEGNSTRSGLLEKAKQLLGQTGAAKVVAEVAAEQGVDSEKVTEILQGPTPTSKPSLTEESTSPSSSSPSTPTSPSTPS